MELDLDNQNREQNYKNYYICWISFLKKYIVVSIVLFILSNIFVVDYSKLIGLVLIFIGLISSDLIGFRYRIHTFSSVKSAAYSSGNNSLVWNTFSIISKIIIFIFIYIIYKNMF
ncbi:MAG: hypothetical protein ACD_58C00296G0014 [uncultured bacterium]|nr:MAG: hypothetical protein ACD_58C00296G0014 [uncultured bacterium]